MFTTEPTISTWRGQGGPFLLTGCIILVLLTLSVGIHDLIQRREPVLRIYPVIGRVPGGLRRLARVSRVATSSAPAPFSADDLESIRSRAQSGDAISSFGTSVDQLKGATSVAVALFPTESVGIEEVLLKGSPMGQPLTVPVLNLGALGYGPVNERVISAFGLAARQVGALLNTGEDGLTPYHLDTGADLIWQLGTGYWGCRTSAGEFDAAAFATRASQSQVKAIELKLSQGAKPGAGSFMPAAKNTAAVARILGVKPNEDIVSPSRHSTFGSAVEMLQFIGLLRQLAGGKAVGLKLCVGSSAVADELSMACQVTGIIPSFISVDGSEGGSGAAPTVLQDHAGLPARIAVSEIDRAFRTVGLRTEIAIFGSGRVRSGYDLFEMLARGADGCFAVRAPLVAIGCVQARICHTGHCPSGLTTHNWWRKRAIVPAIQAEALANYYLSITSDVHYLLRAAGLKSSRDIGPEHLIQLSTGDVSGP